MDEITPFHIKRIDKNIVTFADDTEIDFDFDVET